MLIDCYGWHAHGLPGYAFSACIGLLSFSSDLGPFLTVQYQFLLTQVGYQCLSLHCKLLPVS